MDVLAKALDPPRRAHLELAEKFLAEGKELVDPVQAAEKLYKAAEEAVKAVSLSLREAERAEEAGRWTAALLFEAADSLSERLGEEFRLWWEAAWFLHVEGFHEARLAGAQVKREVPYVEKVVETARREVAHSR